MTEVDPSPRKPAIEREIAVGACAFISIWLLFDAPRWFVAGVFSAVRYHPSADVPLLVALYLGTYSKLITSRTAGILARGFVGLAASALFLYGVDAAVWRALMRSEPLLYDQSVMLRHTLVLLGDLWSVGLFAALLGIAAVTAGSAVLVRWLLRRLRTAFFGLGRGRQAWLYGGLGALSLTSNLLGAERESRSGFLALSLTENISRSVQMHERLQRDIESSVYEKYKSIELTRRPRIEIFFVESYGRILHDDPELRPAWHSWLEVLNESARAASLSVVSSFSEAPVSGGRSWVAEGAVLMGTPVKYEVVFRNLVEEMDRIVNLVGLLNAQGYETVLLAPADRVRLGLENENRYGYDRTVTFDDLQYRGRHVGWGRIPDQYSLSWTREHVLDRSKGPLFFNFHMVSSHAPWEEVPEWQQRIEESPLGGPVRRESRGTTRDELKKRLKRLGRDEDHVFAYRGTLDSMGRRAYARAIAYELRVIGDHLRRSTGDRLVLVLGDHQPPVVAEANASFQVPIHVLASDSALLATFEERGFGRGIIPHPAKAIRHEAILSMVARTLASCCGRGGFVPEVLPEGAPLGG